MVQQAILRREFAFQKIAVRALISVVAGGIVGILMAILGFGVWSLVGQQLTFEVVGGVLMFWSLSHWRTWPAIFMERIARVIGFWHLNFWVQALNIFQPEIQTIF